MNIKCIITYEGFKTMFITYNYYFKRTILFLVYEQIQMYSYQIGVFQPKSGHKNNFPLTIKQTMHLFYWYKLSFIIGEVENTCFEMIYSHFQGDSFFIQNHKYK